MNFYINQTIQINYLRLESISNSSILQIGSAGSIKSLSNLYNTGSYVEPAPEVSASGNRLNRKGPIQDHWCRSSPLAVNNKMRGERTCMINPFPLTCKI